MKDFDVLCIGNAAIDVPLCYVDERVFSTDSFAIDQILPTFGGSGQNVSTILSRLGKKVRLITMLGDDDLAKLILNNCNKNKIDTSGVIINSAVDTPLSIGLVKSDGERTFVVSRNSSTFHFSPEDVNLNFLSNVKVLAIASLFIMPHFEGESLTKLLEKAKSAGLIICADMMKSRDGKRMEVIQSALDYIDYFFANKEEIRFLTGIVDIWQAADDLLNHGVKNVIVKDGKNGCFFKSKSLKFHTPGYENPDLVDTIGAGDNFAAGFIATLLNGYDHRDCARFANATASISVGAKGSTNGVKDIDQVIEFLNSKI